MENNKNMEKCSANPKKSAMQAEIISNKKTAKDHFTIVVKSEFLAQKAMPGQFVNIKVSEYLTDPLLRIPLGVHQIRKSGISLLYKVVGPATRLLSHKTVKEKIDILGPLGKGYDISSLETKEKSQAILVAGGHGVAPLYALAVALRKKKIKVDLFIGACKKEHIVLSDKFKKIEAGVHIATDDGSAGFKGYVTELLDRHLTQFTVYRSPTTIFACGPRPMLTSLAKVAARHDLKAQVSLDAYMACGVGACLGCAVKTKNGYKMVCKDGPVFDAEEIDW